MIKNIFIRDKYLNSLSSQMVMLIILIVVCAFVLNIAIHQDDKIVSKWVVISSVPILILQYIAFQFHYPIKIRVALRVLFILYLMVPIFIYLYIMMI